MTKQFLVAAVVSASLAGASSGPTPVADRVRIEKAARRLTLYHDGKPFRSYEIALGADPIGPKEREGDGRTPEGTYVVDGRNPKSGFHLSLHLSYPNEEDRRRAAAKAEPPGSDIMIHGIKNGLGWLGSMHRLSDWTRGCIAVANEEIEEIWTAVPDGTVVEIVP